MHAEIDSIFSQDIDGIDEELDVSIDSSDFYFNFCVNLSSPSGDEMECFTFIICSPSGFAKNLNCSEIVSGYGHLFMEKYNFSAVESYIQKICNSISGKNLYEISKKINMFMISENNEYRSIESLRRN